MAAKNKSFKQMNKEFSETLDLVQFFNQDRAGRFILVRSLDSAHLQELLAKSGANIQSKKMDDLYEAVFSKGELSEGAIEEYIKKKYPEVRSERIQQEAGLFEVIKNFGSVSCGVRNDKLDDLVKDLVRDKSIRSRKDLEEKIGEKVVRKVKEYALWSYYNQATNDLIEHAFNDHEKVIPTLRKIPGVDFLLKTKSGLVPFDLKITHISDDYFDLMAKGLSPVAGSDSYKVGAERSEIELIKEFYKEMKKAYDLPNYGSFSKSELLNVLAENSFRDKKIDAARKAFLKSRAELVNEIEKNIKSLEWWNYKFQGERLFLNNNRFFIFLAYKNSFEDARPLKGRVDQIKKLVKQKLDALDGRTINTIKYQYEKDPAANGSYEVSCASVLYFE